MGQRAERKNKGSRKRETDNFERRGNNEDERNPAEEERLLHVEVLRVATLRVGCCEKDDDDDHEGEDVVHRSNLKKERREESISDRTRTRKEMKLGCSQYARSELGYR